MLGKGIRQIKIPVRPSEVSIEKITPYIATVFEKFQENATIIEQDYSKYCLNHKILAKTRLHDDSDVNNIVLIPDLKSAIDWKTGYICGNPIKYSESRISGANDITYLNKYVRSSCQRAIDKEVTKWAYATGVGYYFIEPKSYDFDIEVESPYEIYCVPSNTCVKVYSAFGGNKELFDMIHTTYDELVDGKKNTVQVLDVYLPNCLYTYQKREFSTWELVNSQPRGLYRWLPLVEKRWNTDGIGLVAMGESMLNALEQVMSDCLDNVSDVVNETWIFYNAILGDTPTEKKENFQQGRKNGVFVLNDPSSDCKAKADTISTKLNLAEVQGLFAMINEKFHASIGVPMEMSNTNSGGTTKQGSEVANGYDNAYNKALDDINTLIMGDTKLLERVMWICKNTPNNKIIELDTSEIEIKYSLNLTDNILTKTQAYVNLVQVGVPPSMALRLCRLSNDPEAEGKIIEDNILKLKQTDNDSQE